MLACKYACPGALAVVAVLAVLAAVLLRFQHTQLEEVVPDSLAADRQALPTEPSPGPGGSSPNRVVTPVGPNGQGATPNSAPRGGGAGGGAATTGADPFTDSEAGRCDGPHVRSQQGRRQKIKQKDHPLLFQPAGAPLATSAGLVHLDCRGQWGNNLGQYAVARVIADELGFGLKVCPSLLDKNWKGGHIFPGIVQRAAAAQASGAPALPKIEYGKHAYEVEKILADHSPRVRWQANSSGPRVPHQPCIHCCPS